VEIQIRTPEMNAEAAYGIVAHFIYKELEEKNGKNEKIKSRLEWVNQLKELKGIVDSPTKFIEGLKTDLFRDRISFSHLRVMF